MSAPASVALVLCSLWTFGAGWLRAEPVRVGPVEAELFVDGRSAAGEAFLAAVKLTLDPGWHVYWENPGSPGLPPTVEWKLPEGYQAGPFLFPPPHRFAAAGFTSYGYEEAVVLLTRIVPPAGAGVPDGIEASVVWLACEEQCIRGSATLKASPASSEAVASLIDAAVAALPQPVDWKVTGTFDAATGGVTFSLADGRAVDVAPENLYFFPAASGITDSAKGQKVAREGDGLVVTATADKKFAGDFPGEIGGVLAAEDGSSWRIGGEPSGLAVSTAEPEGASQGWGYWLQRPFIVAALAGVMILIALNLAGVFEIGGSLTGVGSGLAQKEGLAGSFFSGALATLLATPCTAPAMGFAITFALGSSTFVAVVIFTLIALGMATPYLLLSAFPAWTAKLPRPGAWMETFKQSMAFPMWLVVAWLLSVLAQQVDAGGFFWMLVALVFVGLAAWVYGRFATLSREARTRRIAWGSVAGLAFLAVSLLSSNAGRERPPVPRDVEAEIAALQAEGKSVFVDFTASWCLTCQANKPSIHHPDVERAFGENGIALLEVDWTQEDPRILKTLQKHGREGVPLYLLFSPDPSAPPQVLPNVLTPQIIISAIGGGEVAEPRELGLFAALGFAFLGGMLLNLMPCVFPVISLKIMGFVSQAGEDRKRILQHGFAFTAGVLVFFWILTGALLIARASFAG